VDLNGHVLKYCTMHKVWSQLKETAEVEKRLLEVDAFNQVNLILYYLLRFFFFFWLQIFQLVDSEKLLLNIK
jgi:hypothetical protein